MRIEDRRTGPDPQFSILNPQSAFAALWLVVIASRWFAVSKSLLDWDETLFAFALEEYGVEVHHPHPPGYPLFIAAAKLLRPLVASDFRALQLVATIGSALLFPAAFLLARELRMRTREAVAAALITSFLPTIWYHGGTALSDVPALALALFASALLLRGTPRSYFAGCVVAAIAAGFRPQLLLICAVPALWSAATRRRFESGARAPHSKMLISWLVGAVLVALFYLAAAYFSSDFPTGYLTQVRVTTEHVGVTDSWRNPRRMPLSELAPRALWFPFAGGRARYWIFAFAAMAIFRRDRTVLLLLLMFVPTALFTWAYLDPTCMPRYAIAYAPAYAFLAAAGIGAIGDRLGRFSTAFVIVNTLTITAMLINWVRPAVQDVRKTSSPPVAAFEWVRTNVPRVGPRVFIENELMFHGQYLMRDYDPMYVFEPHHIRAEDLQPGNVLVIEGKSKERGARLFAWERDELWLMARNRYFEVSVIPMHSMFWYRDGWYGWEDDGAFRWMSSNGGVFLPALPPKGELHMHFYLPIDSTPRPPLVTVTWNGVVIDRLRATSANVDLRYVLESRADRPNELDLSVDVWANPKRDGTGEDGRDLGLKLQSLSWQ